MKRFALLFAALLSASSLAAQGSVLVVDPSNGPGTDFTTLADALTAAVDGDFLLLRTGDHPPATLDGKALFLIEDEGATATIDKLTVQDVPAGKSVVVRGVEIDTGTTSAGSLFLQDCAGTVWFEDCQVSDTVRVACVTCRDCASVVFVDCGMSGGSESACGATGALTTLRSNVFLFDTTIQGVDGYVLSFPPFCCELVDGQEAVRLEDGTLWVQGSALTGGYGGWNTNPSSCIGASSGGAGLALRGTAPVASVLDSTLMGGFGGLGYCGPDGSDGPPIDMPVGTVDTIAASARTLEIPSPVQVGGEVTLTWHGEPTDRAFLLYSLRVGPGQLLSRLLVPALVIGPSFLAAPRKVVAAGVLDGSGTLLEPVSLAGLDTGLEGLSVYVQGLLFDVSRHEFLLSNPAHALLLDLGG